MIYLLCEDIDAVRKYYPNIPDDMFMTLIQLDPDYSGNNSLGKNGKWILNLYNKGIISEEDFEDVTKTLEYLKLYRNRLKNKNILDYKSLEDLQAAILEVSDDMSMLSARQRTRFLKNVKAGRTQIPAEDDYETVFDDDKFVVWIPRTHEASMKLGKGTNWCTAHENPDWFRDYTVDGNELYIIKDKKTGERYQYTTVEDVDDRVLDEWDQPFPVVKKLIMKDEKLAKFLNELDEDVFPLVSFVNGFVIKNGDLIDMSLDLQQEKSITLPDAATGIAPECFMDSNIESIYIPDSVQYLGRGAFKGCYCLRSIELPDSVTDIMVGAFEDCDNLVSAKLPAGLTWLRADTFNGCDSLKSVTMPTAVENIGQCAFYECMELDNIDIGYKVQTIDSCAFYHTGLTSIYIPKSCNYIGTAAFKNCPSLKEVTIAGSSGNEVVIQDSAFMNCRSLSTLRMANVITISSDAFMNCSSLTSVRIPRSVVNIHAYAFAECDNLHTVIMQKIPRCLNLYAFCGTPTTIYTGDVETLQKQVDLYENNKDINITVKHISEYNGEV